MIPISYSMISHTEESQKKIKDAYAQKNLESRESSLNIGETMYEAPKNYKGSHYDHFYNFFQSIRNKKVVVEDPTFGLRAAGAALLANEGYYQGKAVDWDPDSMKLL